MLTAKACVQYEGDWTAQLASYDVFAEFVASTFRDRRYIGLVAVDCRGDDLDDVLAVIEGHPTTDTLEVVEQYDADARGRVSLTLFLRGHLTEFTPLQTLLYEGFLPIGSTTLEHGRECFDLLLDDREELSKAVELLSEFGNTSVERITDEFSHEITPSHAEWQELLSSIPDRRREILNCAVEQGYFEIPREITLEELAARQNITKTTASTHIRKSEKQLIEFLLPYVNLAARGE